MWAKRSPITCNAAMAGGPNNLPSTDRLSYYASLFSVYFQIIKKRTEFQGLGIKITDKKNMYLYISCKRQKPQDIVYFNLQILSPKSAYVCMCVMEEQSNPKVKSLEPPIQYLLSSSFFIFHSGVTLTHRCCMWYNPKMAGQVETKQNSHLSLSSMRLSCAG